MVRLGCTILMALVTIILYALLQQTIAGSVCIDKSDCVIQTGVNTSGNCNGAVYMNTEKIHIGINQDASLGINTLSQLPNDLGYILGITRLYNETNEYGYYHQYTGDYIFQNGYDFYQLTTIEAWQYSTEGWNMQWSDANGNVQQRYNWYNNNFINDPNTKVTSIPTRKMSITSSANSESVIWLSIDDQVSIRTIVSIDHYTHNMKYTVSIKNIANETLRNVTYNRIFDPDLRKYRYYELHANTDDIMGVFETYNYVKYQANSAAISDESLNKFVRSTEPLESLVWATSQEMDKHIGIGAINSHSKVGFCPLVNAVTLYTNFITLCADTEWEPYGGVTIDNGMIEDMSHSDDFLYLNMLYPIIQPGEIFSFSYYYLLNITEEEVVVTDTTRLIIAQPTEILTGTNSLVVIYSTDLLTVLELLVFGAANTWESIGNYTYESENIQIISAFNSSRSYYCYNIYLDSTQYSDETNVHMKAVAHVGDEKLSAHKSISIANTGRSSCDDAYLGFSVDSPVVSLRSCDTTDHDATILSVKYYREIFVDGVEIASTYVGESTSYPYIAHVRIDDLLSSINSENLYPIYVKAVVTRMVNNEVYETAVVFSGYFNNADIDSPTANIVFYYIVAGVSSAVVLAAIAYGYRVYNPSKSKTDTKQQYINDDIPELKSDIFNYNSSFKSSSNQTSLTTTPASSPSSSMKKASLVTVNDAAKPIENEIYFEFDTVYPVNEHFL